MAFNIIHDYDRRMTRTDPRIDAYIAAAQPFAQPVLRAIRAGVHGGCPDAQETVKWGFPHFVYKGKVLCSMAAFKAHASLGFWHGEMVAQGVDRGLGGMGQFGRMGSVDDLPVPATLTALIKKAAELIDAGVKPPRMVRREPRAEIALPPAFVAALEANPAARHTLAGFAPSHRRDYVEWIVEAKHDDTRDRRIAQAIAWLADGKRRNWKYENC